MHRIRAFTLAALCTTLVLTVQIGQARADLGSVVTVPGTIPADCSSDAQPALTTFIAGVPDHSVIVFPSGSCYLLNAPLSIFNRTQLALDGAGSTLRSGVTLPDCSGPGIPGHILSIRQGTDVTVYGFTLIGTNPVPGHFDPTYYCAHGINVNTSTRVNIRRVAIQNVYGDCFYFGGGPTTGVNYATVTDSTCTGPGREGVSVVDGDFVEVINNVFTNYRNGITTDKNVPADHAASLHVIGNQFLQGHGTDVNLKGGATSSGAVIVDNTDSSAGSVSIVLNGPGGGDQLANLVVAGNQGNPAFQRGATYQVYIQNAGTAWVVDGVSHCTSGANGGDQGIRFGGTVDTVTVTHNDWTNCAEYKTIAGTVLTNALLYANLHK